MDYLTQQPQSFPSYSNVYLEDASGYSDFLPQYGYEATQDQSLGQEPVIDPILAGPSSWAEQQSHASLLDAFDAFVFPTHEDHMPEQQFYGPTSVASVPTPDLHEPYEAPGGIMELDGGGWDLMPQGPIQLDMPIEYEPQVYQPVPSGSVRGIDMQIGLPDMTGSILPLSTVSGPNASTPHAETPRRPPSTRCRQSSKKARESSGDNESIIEGFICGYPHPDNKAVLANPPPYGAPLALSYCNVLSAKMPDQKRHLTLKHGFPEFLALKSGLAQAENLVFGGTEVKVRPTKCHLCGKDLSRVDSLDRHLKTGCNGERVPSRDPQEPSYVTFRPIPGSSDDLQLRRGLFPLQIRGEFGVQGKKRMTQIVEVQAWAQQAFKTRLICDGKETSIQWVEGVEEGGIPFYMPASRITPSDNNIARADGGRRSAEEVRRPKRGRETSQEEAPDDGQRRSKRLNTE